MAAPSERSTVDEVREYWNRRPCNIRHSRQPIGTREYFDEVEARKYMVEPHIPGFANFERWRGKKILEIGCGIGTDTISFARAGADVTAVDLSRASLDLAQRRFATFGLKARFFLANAERLSETVPPEPYDLIYSFGVIHHTPNPAAVMAELRKYCGPQTELRVMVYARWSWKVLWILLKFGRGAFWRLDELIRQNSEAETGCPVTYVYSEREARQLMSGFDVVSVAKDHIFPYVIDRYVKYEYRFAWYFRYLPGRVFHWLERRLGWHMLLVARPIATG